MWGHISKHKRNSDGGYGILKFPPRLLVSKKTGIHFSGEDSFFGGLGNPGCCPILHWHAPAWLALAWLIWNFGISRFLSQFRKWGNITGHFPEKKSDRQKNTALALPSDITISIFLIYIPCANQSMLPIGILEI